MPRAIGVAYWYPRVIKQEIDVNAYRETVESRMFVTFSHWDEVGDQSRCLS
jgi:hypothetical protein